MVHGDVCVGLEAGEARDGAGSERRSIHRDYAIGAAFEVGWRSHKNVVPKESLLEVTGAIVLDGSYRRCSCGMKYIFYLLEG